MKAKAMRDACRLKEYFNLARSVNDLASSLERIYRVIDYRCSFDNSEQNRLDLGLKEL